MIYMNNEVFQRSYVGKRERERERERETKRKINKRITKLVYRWEKAEACEYL